MASSPISPPAQPRLSVVITTHKALDYLRICVESVLANARLPVEIVIYADGSPDGTRRYLEELAVRPELDREHFWLRSRYESQNVGITRATNRAAELATAPWLYFVNDDMVFAPEFDAALLREAAPGRVLTGTMVEPIRENMGVDRHHIKANFGLRADEFDWERWQKESPGLASPEVQPGLCYPFCVERELFFRVGAIDERFDGASHDPDLFYRFILAGAEAVRVRGSLCYHFSGRSLRFEGDRPVVSPRWIEQEFQGRVMFLRKWGEDARLGPGGVPQPGAKAPDGKLGWTKRLTVEFHCRRLRRKKERRLKRLASSPPA